MCYRRHGSCTHYAHGLLPTPNPARAQENTTTGEWEFDVEVYRTLQSDGSTVEKNLHVTIVARLSEAKNRFTGSYIDASASSYNACTEAEITGSIQGDQVTWTVHYTGSCCLDAEMMFTGTLSQDKKTMTGTLSPVRNPPSNCELWWANVTGTKVTASDTEPPTVSWVKPVGNGASHTATSGTVELEVSATDNGDIQSVEFWRYDAENEQLVGINTDSSPPYQASVSVSSLNVGWNEIAALAKDAAGNQVLETIFIYRQSTITLDPAKGAPGSEVTVQGSGWLSGETVFLQFVVNMEADGSYTEDTIWYDVGEATVGDDGSFETTFTVPADATDTGAQGVSVDTYEASEQAVAFFHVVPEPEETPPPEDEPSFNPQVTGLQFYESGYGELPPEQRVYAERFASETSRYINWELDLEYVAPGSPVDFKITAIYLRDTGTGSWEELNRYTVDAHVEGDQTGGSHWSGYGCNEPEGCWATGLYRVDIYFEGLGTDGQLMASQGFEISGEAETTLVANAGPDQTVPGPSPVTVQFDGSGSTGDIVSYKWHNQWGLLLVEGATPVIEVNFGHEDPQPGTQRTFTLVVEDSQGNTAQDEVTITLGETQEEEPSCPTPTVTLSVSSGKPGDTITVQGEDWLPGGTVAIALVDQGVQLDVGSVQVPDSGAWETSFNVPDAPHDYWLAFSESHEGCELYVQDIFSIVAPSDTEPPTVSWIKPVGNREYYPTANSTVELEVSATDNAGIRSVVFERWDAVNSQLIELTTDSSAPYQARIELNTLNIGWNQINAIVEDTTGNQAGEPIMIYRLNPAITLDPTEGFQSKVVTVKGSGWFPGETVILNLGEPPSKVGQATVDGDGNFTAKFAVPANAAFGEQKVIASAGNGFWQADAIFRVTEPEETPTPTPTPVPPPTATPTPPPNQPPVITLVGDDPLNVVQGCPFIDPKATATDPEDGDLTDSVIVEGSVNINAPGPYLLTYKVKDSDELWAVKTRQVIVFGVISPNYPCVFAKPEGRAPNLVVIVHGCCSDAHDVYSLKKKFSDAIGRAFSQNPPPEPWEIVVWDWTKCTSDPNVECTPKPDLDPQDVDKAFRTAYENALNQGLVLANAIANYPYKHVHLIGHSAGSKLIQRAAEELVLNYKSHSKDTFIHLTFLDAYTRLDSDKTTYGFLANYQQHYSEHYVDMGLLPFTNEILNNAFNFDITHWKGAAKGDPIQEHWWPVNWYIQSITASEFRYGFPLAREGGNNEFDQISTSFPPKEECKLYDKLSPCLWKEVPLKP